MTLTREERHILNIAKEAKKTMDKGLEHIMSEPQLSLAIYLLVKLNDYIMEIELEGNTARVNGRELINAVQNARNT